MSEEKEDIKEENIKNDVIEIQKEQIVEKNDLKEEPKKGYSIASLILGIVSIVLMSSFFIAVAGGVLAIIFGLKGKKMAGVGMAKAGFIMGIIGTGIQISIILLVVLLGATMLTVLL